MSTRMRTWTRIKMMITMHEEDKYKMRMYAEDKDV